MDQDGPGWARGYEVAELKRMTAMVAEHDRGLVHGAFGRYSERTLAEELAAGRVSGAESSGWLLSCRRLERPQSVRDFTGGLRLRLPAGTLSVTRLAWRETWEREACLAELSRLAGGRRPVAVQCWQEHPGERELVAAAGLQLGAVKIAASSEMRGVYVRPELAPPPYPPAQAMGLGLLPVRLPPLGPLIAEVAQLGEYAAHYSSYNQRGTWTALSLRGYYDEPERIEKPAEMSQRWKSDHSGDLSRPVRDTELRGQLPAVEPILAALPAQGLERVRLMQLAPGGGELTRHADITDRAAGAEVGRVVRLHVPLITNELVRFSGWDLDGRERAGVMAVGGCYYLDTRKPHTAFNGGEVPRVHLVADVLANAETVAALAAAREFAPA